jgi:putative transposase
VKTREAGRIVSVAVIVAVGVNTDGQREVLGLKVGHSEAEPFWTEFLRSLNRRDLRGVKLVISDSHEGIKSAISKVFKATWQRCRVHFMRNALAHAGKTQRRMVSAAIGTVFVQDSADAARTQWRSVADQLRGKFPKLGTLMDEAENDVLAFMTFPRAHWTQIYSTNPLERLNAEIKRRTNVVGIFPNDASITRLVGAMMLEQNDEWSLNRRYMQLEGLQTLSDTVPTRLSAVAAEYRASQPVRAVDLHHAVGHSGGLSGSTSGPHRLRCQIAGPETAGTFTIADPPQVKEDTRMYTGDAALSWTSRCWGASVETGRV